MTGTMESRFAARIDEFRQEAARVTQARQRATDPREIEELTRQEHDIKDREMQYLLDTMPFIKEHSSTTAMDVDAPPPPGAPGSLASYVSVTHKSNKNNVLQRYLRHVEKQVDPVTQAAFNAHLNSDAKRHPREAEYFCPGCEKGMDFHGRESMLVCPHCGTCRTFTEMSAANLTYEQEIHQDVITYFAYKRNNHFCEWLNSLQAKVRARFFCLP